MYNSYCLLVGRKQFWIEYAPTNKASLEDITSCENIPSHTNKMKTMKLEVAWCFVQMMKVSNLHHFSSKSYFRV